MKQSLSVSIIARGVIALLLFWALSTHQYGYYVFLRWITCGICAYCMYLSYSLSKTPWAWLFGFLAMFFNPIAPIRLDRQTWAYLDVATGILLLVSILFIRESLSSKGESHE